MVSLFRRDHRELKIRLVLQTGMDDVVSRVDGRYRKPALYVVPCHSQAQLLTWVPTYDLRKDLEFKLRCKFHW